MAELSRADAPSESIEAKPATTPESPIAIGWEIVNPSAQLAEALRRGEAAAFDELKRLAWDAEHGNEADRRAASFELNRRLAELRRQPSNAESPAAAATVDLAVNLFAGVGPADNPAVAAGAEVATTSTRVYTEAEIAAAQRALLKRRAKKDDPASPEFLKFADLIRTPAALPMIYHWIACRHEEALMPEESRRLICGESPEPTPTADVTARDIAKHLAEELRRQPVACDAEGTEAVNANNCSHAPSNEAQARPLTLLEPAGDHTDKQPKRRQYNRDARSLIVSFLLAHHGYDAQGCTKFDPIRVKELSKKLGVSPGSVSRVFKGFGQFRTGDHSAYEAACVGRNAKSLNDWLQRLSVDVPAGRERLADPRDLETRNVTRLR